MEFLTLFEQLDRAGAFEKPRGFSYQKALQRFTAFAASLSQAGIAAESQTGNHIQDASFHSELYLPDIANRQAVLRFSNFGEFAALDDEDEVNTETLSVIKHLLVEQGYVYVPTATILLPYYGKYKDVLVDGKASWWERFFDYG